MRKFLSGLGIALLLAGCANDRLVESNDFGIIGFSTAIPGSRASVADYNTLQQNATGFGVICTKTDVNDDSFIDTYKYAASAWGWGTTARYWPAELSGEYPLNFHAYYPVAADGFAAPANYAGAQAVDYTIVDDAHASAQGGDATTSLQTDFLAAKGTALAYSATPSSVNLAFRHILSRIDFKFKVADGVNVEIVSIRIKNVANHNKYNMAAEAWTANLGAPTKGFTYFNYKSATRAIQTIAGTTTTAATPVAASANSNYLMLMPQGAVQGLTINIDRDADTYTNNATGAYIELVYRMWDANGDIVGTADVDAGTAGNQPGYVVAAFPLNLTQVYSGTNPGWQPGYAYTYVISLGMGGSGGYLADNNYKKEDGTDTGEEVVDGNGDDIKPGDPLVITNDPTVIGFSVTVGNWVNYNSGGADNGIVDL